MCTIPPDPDVSGIGVRTAVYIQAVVSAFQFALIPLLLHTLRKGRHLKKAKHFYRRGRASMSALLITCMGLLISTYIKQRFSRVSRYHAVIAMNLSWILCLSALSNILVLRGMESAVPRLEHEVEDFAHIMMASDSSADFNQNDNIDWPVLFGCLWTIGRVGITVYDNAYRPSMLCGNSTVVWMFGRVSHLSEEALFALYLTIMTFAVLFPLALWAVREPRIQWMIPLRFCGPPPRVLRLLSAPFFLSLALLSAVISLVIIVDTEKTIAANDVAEGEMVWGFGQTTALLLVVTPVWAALRTGWDVIALWMAPKPEHEYELLPIQFY